MNRSYMDAWFDLKRCILNAESERIRLRNSDECTSDEKALLNAEITGIRIAIERMEEIESVIRGEK